MKCNQSRPGFEPVSPCPFPPTITITPRVPPIKLLFFPCLFLSYCHSVVHSFVDIVSDGCNQSAFVFSSRCIDASTLSSVLTSPLPPSFLDTYSLSTLSLRFNALCMVIIFLFFGPFVQIHLWLFFISVPFLFQYILDPSKNERKNKRISPIEQGHWWWSTNLFTWGW